MNDTLKICLLIGVVLIGAFIAYIFRNKKIETLDWAMSFSGAFIFGVLFIETFPFVYSHHFHGFLNPSICILLGFLIQIFLDQISMGVEHGHMHGFHGKNVNQKAITVLLGLSVHSFIEGLPLSESITHNHQHGLFYSIILHKATAAFVIAIILFKSKLKKNLILILIALFAIMTPMGLMTSTFISFNQNSIVLINALVAGSLLHIATTILFEIDNQNNHRLSLIKIGSILFGLVVAYLSIMH
ncbi:MAG: ZIP family metal transporter [Bacteroidota bacterium]